MLTFIIGILLAICFFLGGVVVSLRYRQKINHVLEKYERGSEEKARVIHTPKRGQKWIQQHIKSNHLQGKSTPISELYD